MECFVERDDRKISLLAQWDTVGGATHRSAGRPLPSGAHSSTPPASLAAWPPSSAHAHLPCSSLPHLPEASSPAATLWQRSWLSDSESWSEQRWRVARRWADRRAARGLTGSSAHLSPVCGCGAVILCLTTWSTVPRSAAAASAAAMRARTPRVLGCDCSSASVISPCQRQQQQHVATSAASGRLVRVGKQDQMVALCGFSLEQEVQATALRSDA